MMRGVALPIHAVLDAIRAAVETGPVVVTAATGSGKSTEVPRICPRPVVVVEPRRVACRSLAARVAELEGTRLGDGVGYVVRDEHRAGPRTGITFVTPGVALRALDDYLERAGTLVVDEVHERTLEVDLLLALVRGRARRLVVMSATIDADRIADHLEARRVDAPGRAFPVEVEYDASGPTVPSAERLPERVRAALESLGDGGDTLVFLPGKGEIGATKATLRGLSNRSVVELHGGLSLSEQSAAFAPSDRPKVILSTNVAETSVTVPGVRAVVDAGLVRQLRYVQGRGTLTLTPVARDAAEQRAGRAGRTAPGRCLRLWRPNAHLETHTPPEVHRLPLVPLVLAARAHGADPDRLPWLDAPKPHALEAAQDELTRLGALDVAGDITDRGRALFRLPVDPWLGRLLVEAETRGLLDDAIDLCAALELSRPMFSDPRDLDEDDPRRNGCDIVALVRAVRAPVAGAIAAARAEARDHRARLRRVFGRAGPLPEGDPDRPALLRALLAADPLAARVRRSRGRRTAWGGAGTELELDRRSAAELGPSVEGDPLPEAIGVLSLRSLREGPRTRLVATAATPIPLSLLDELGFGEPRVAQVRLHRGRIRTEVERVFAGRVLGKAEHPARGAELREATAVLIERGRLMKGVWTALGDRLEQARLARRLARAHLITAGEEDFAGLPDEDQPGRWLRARLDEVGLEEQEDLQLLEPEDLLPPTLPYHLADAVQRDYPRRVDLGEALYEVQYDLARRQAVLVLSSGGRHRAPPRSYLPRFPGLKVSIQAGGSLVELG